MQYRKYINLLNLSVWTHKTDGSDCIKGQSKANKLNISCRTIILGACKRDSRNNYGKENLLTCHA